MFLKKPGHTKRLIKNLYTVWLPPPPQREQIAGWTEKKENQFWKRQPLPQFYTDRREEEKSKQEAERKLVDAGELDRIRHFDPQLEAYRRQQWHNRIYGYWFMNNGEPVYLTGAHWYYLQWSKFDHADNDGYPIFYEPQLDRFYFRQMCWEDPWCWGYLFVGPRGFGKTSEEASVTMEDITKPPHKRHAAIQSKTADDAKTVIFAEKMVPLFNELPDFFKPEHSHGTDPDKMMKFKRANKSGEVGRRVKTGPDFELGNTVKWYPAKEKAVDGKGLATIISDEVGKTHPNLEANVQVRNSVHTRCVFRNQRKVGLIRATTTVEEMNEGGDQCWEIWKDSSPLAKDRDGNGYTKSKLYKYLVSGLETQTQLADKYGRIPEKEAYTIITNEREPVKDDAVKLSQLTRKTPLNENEAFIKDQSKCMFNIFILTKALEIVGNEPQGRVGHLQWVRNIVDGEVEFIDDPLTGDFTIYYFPDATKGTRRILNPGEFMIDSSNGKKLWLPSNNDFFRGGLDPIKYIKTDDPRASKMAAYGMRMWDPLVDDPEGDPLTWLSNSIMWEYMARHEDPEEDYENIIKAMRYFGHSIMPESNITDFSKHMVSRGYWRHMIVRRNFDPTVLMQKNTKNNLGADQGVHSYGEVIDSYVRRIKQYVNRNGLRIKSKRLLEQLRDFDSKNPTKFDLVVAFGYALIALEANLDDITTQKMSEIAINPWPQYDISGNRSQLITPQVTPGTGEFDFENPQKFQEWLHNSK